MRKTIAALSLMAAAPLLAHHVGEKAYDKNKPVTLSGVVAKIEWINPHAWIILDVQDANGKFVTWSLEGPDPNRSIVFEAVPKR